MTTAEVRKDSYRALLHLRANGAEVSDFELNVFRREEDLIRGAMALPQHYVGCGVEPAHFQAPIHALAWQAIMWFTEQNATITEIDGAALLCEMRRLDAGDERLGGARGIAWLSGVLAEPVVQPEHALLVLVPEVLQRHRHRWWDKNFKKLGARVDTDRDIVAVETAYVTLCSDLLSQVEGEGRVSGPVESLEWDPRVKTSGSLVPTGNRFIDRYAAGGHGRGELLVWGGGTNHGKSYAAERLLADQARLGNRSLYISCEDPWELMYCRMVADYSRGKLSPAEIRQKIADPVLVDSAQSRLKEAQQKRVFVVEQKKPTIDQVCREIRKYARVHQIDMVLVDYLQAISAPGFETNKTREMAEVTSRLKKTFTEVQVAGIAFSQYSREQYKDGAEPTINACKYCGDIENEAEIMVMFWKDADDVLRAKIPKMKWAKAARGGLRFMVPVDPVTGCHGEWEEDFGEE